MPNERFSDEEWTAKVKEFADGINADLMEKCSAGENGLDLMLMTVYAEALCFRLGNLVAFLETLLKDENVNLIEKTIEHLRQSALEMREITKEHLNDSKKWE